MFEKLAEVVPEIAGIDFRDIDVAARVSIDRSGAIDLRSLSS